MREYKHGQEHAKNLAGHKSKFQAFKGQMENALQLIHKIQDEMGLRHSDMFRHMSKDIAETRSNLQQYVSDGLTEINGKMDTLEEREAAIAAKLMALIESQATQLTNKMVQQHDEEKQKIQNVRDFTEKMEKEQKESDARISDAIDRVKDNLESIDKREMTHFEGMTARIGTQDAKESKDRDDISAKMTADVAELRSNVTQAMADAKAATLHRIDVGIQGVRDDIAALAKEAKESDEALRARMAAHGTEQAANNEGQQEEIKGLLAGNADLKEALVGRLAGLEQNVTALEAAIELSREQIAREQAERSKALLVKIDNELAAMEQKTSELKKHGDDSFAAVNSDLDSLRAALQAAKEEVAARRAKDLSDLQTRLSSELAKVSNQTRAALSEIDASFRAGLNAASVRLAAKHAELKSAEEKRLAGLLSSVREWTAEQQRINGEQESGLTQHKIEVAKWKAELAATTGGFKTELSGIEQRLGEAQRDLERKQQVAAQQLLSDLDGAVMELRNNISDTLSGVRQEFQSGKRMAMQQGRNSLDKVDADVVGYSQSESSALETLSESRASSNSARQDKIEELRKKLKSERDAVALAIKEMDRDTGYLGSNLTASKEEWEAGEAQSKARVESYLSGKVSNLTSTLEAAVEAMKEAINSHMAEGSSQILARMTETRSQDAAMISSVQAKFDGFKADVKKRHRAQEREVSGVKRGSQRAEDEAEQTLKDSKLSVKNAEAQLTRAERELRAAVASDHDQLKAYLAKESSKANAKLSADISNSNSTLVASLEDGLAALRARLNVLSRAQRVARAQLKGDVEEAAGKQAAANVQLSHDIQALALQTSQDKQRQDESVTELSDKVAALGEAVHAAKLAAESDRHNKQATLNASLAQGVVALSDLVSNELAAHKKDIYGRVSAFDAAAQRKEEELKQLDDRRISELQAKLDQVKSTLQEHIADEAREVHISGARQKSDKLDSQGKLESLTTAVQMLKGVLESTTRELTQQRDSNKGVLDQKISDGLELLEQNQTARVSQAWGDIQGLISSQISVEDDQLSRLESKADEERSTLRVHAEAAASKESRLSAETLKQINQLSTIVSTTHDLVEQHTAALKSSANSLDLAIKHENEVLQGQQQADKSKLLASLRMHENALNTARETLATTSAAEIKGITDALSAARSKIEAEDKSITDAHSADMSEARGNIASGLAKLESDLLAALNKEASEAEDKVKSEVGTADASVQRLVSRASASEAQLRANFTAVDHAEAAETAAFKARAAKLHLSLQQRQFRADQSLQGMDSQLSGLERALSSARSDADSDQQAAVLKVGRVLERRLSALNASMLSSADEELGSLSASTTSTLQSLRDDLQKLLARASRSLSKSEDRLQTIRSKEASDNAGMLNDIKSARNNVANLKSQFASSLAGLNSRSSDLQQSMGQVKNDMAEMRVRDQSLVRSEMTASFGKLSETLAQLAQQQKARLVDELSIKSQKLQGRVGVYHDRLKRRSADLTSRVQKLVDTAQKRAGRLQAQLETLQQQQPRDAAKLSARIAELEKSLEEIKMKQGTEHKEVSKRLEELMAQVDAAKGSEQSIIDMKEDLKKVQSSLTALRALHNSHIADAKTELNKVNALRATVKRDLNLAVNRVKNAVNSERRARKGEENTQARQVKNYNAQMKNVDKKLKRKLAGPAPKGPTGDRGPRGPQGPEGPVGLQGFKGMVGARGATGPRGEPGPVGAVGPKGNQGRPGGRGPRGPQGEPGPQGAVGPVGNPGPEGARGPRGAPGPMGVDGTDGENGATGPEGDVGLPGLQGEAGAQGPVGVPGVPGRDLTAVAKAVRKGGMRLKEMFGGKQA